MARAPTWCSLARLTSAYERVQVELHGKYSIQRVADLQAFQRTYTTWACAMILLVAPLPCLVIIILTDVVPLNAPSDGYRHNAVCFLRFFCVAFAIGVALLEQARRFVVGLPLSTRMIWALSTTAAAVTTAFAYLLALVIGFPIPFAMITCSPSFNATMVTSGYVLWGKLLRASPRMRLEMLAYGKLLGVQFTLTLVYPAYNFIFIQLTEYQQTAFALVLPVLKLIAKNAIHAVSNPELEDFKPEVVVFSVEVFHSLFVSCCMQSSRSWTTTITLMTLDFVHMRFGMHDISIQLRSIEALESKLRAAEEATEPPQAERLSLIDKVLYYAEYDVDVRRDASIRFQAVQTADADAATIFPMTSPTLSVAPKPRSGPSLTPAIRKPQPRKLMANVLVSPADFKHSSFGALTPRERVAYVCKILQALHIAEFMLLAEFVEVIVPVIYCVYLTAMFFLPNRVYYPQLDNMDKQSLLSTIGSTLAYASLEFVSFILLCIALRRKLGLSPLHQLAFVLRTQWNLVQSKLILWVVVNVHMPLIHFGYDFSFRFAWLRRS